MSSSIRVAVDIALAASMALGLCACARLTHPDPADVDESKPVALVQPVTVASQSFFADHKARRPGDVVTVLIVESAEVQQSARTKSAKNQSFDGSLLQKDGDVQRWDGQLGTQYDGGGSIERSGRLLAKLAVIVRDVDEFGNLHVYGKQSIVINSERQLMSLTGVVRPDDIGPDNTVLSWRVTGANISLGGRGFLSRKQSPGLVAQLMSFFGA
jgi:flagellar L-ring protein precursor FlgH